MIPRNWLLAVIVGLLSGTISMAPRAAAGYPARNAPVWSSVSPYHPVPLNAPAKKSAAADKPIEPVKHTISSSIEDGRKTPMEQAPIVTSRETPAVEKPKIAALQPLADADVLEALRCCMENRPEEAEAHLAGYHPVDRGLLLRSLALLAQIQEGDTYKKSAQEMASLVEQIERMQALLRSGAALVIDKMCFCRQIERFGVYEPLPVDHGFKPGETVRVYLELKNFSCEKSALAAGRDMYATQLTSAAEIRDASGKAVWKQSFQRNRSELSRSARHDHFEHYLFSLPQLSPGTYTMWIEITDQATRRTAGNALAFRVTGRMLALPAVAFHPPPVKK